MNIPLPTSVLPGSCAPGTRLSSASPIAERGANYLPSTAACRRRTGFERIRKPAALLCIAVWLYAALCLPVRHGGAMEWMALFGQLLVAFAVFGRIWSTLHIGGHKNGRLCRSGPYAYTRNPLYFFSWLGVTGIAMIFRQPWLVPLAWLGFLVSFAPLIHIEEGRLAQLFGVDFDQYRREVPRFFPRWGRRTQADDGTTQTPGKLAQIERSLADALWFLVASALADTLIVGGGWEALQAFIR